MAEESALDTRKGESGLARPAKGNDHTTEISRWISPRDTIGFYEIERNSWEAAFFSIIPEVPVKELYRSSGKLLLRLAPHVHEEAARIAKNEGVSLNQ